MTMLINVIPKVEVNISYVPERIEEFKVLTYQPDNIKTAIILYNYWDENKRGELSEDAKLRKLVLDFDNGAHRKDVEERFKNYEYIIYNSTGNSASQNLEKFRIIITLKEPVTARTMRYWFQQKALQNFPLFKGCDVSSFNIGRYFVAPSKYDKDRKPVTVTPHKGIPFDFHAFFKEHSYMEEKFEQQRKDLIRKQNAQQSERKVADNAIDKLQAHIDRIGAMQSPPGLHYMCMASVIGKGQSLGLDEYTVRQMFKNNYVGSSDWEKNWDKCWDKYNQS